MEYTFPGVDTVYRVTFVNNRVSTRNLDDKKYRQTIWFSKEAVFVYRLINTFLELAGYIF